MKVPGNLGSNTLGPLFLKLEKATLPKTASQNPKTCLSGFGRLCGRKNLESLKPKQWGKPYTLRPGP